MQLHEDHRYKAGQGNSDHPHMRSLAVVIAGSVVALITYWGGAVIALLTMHGIPLGSAGGPPSRGDVAVHLALAALGSVAGSLVAVRLARNRPQWHAAAVGLLLGIGAVSGFTKASSQWPTWFGFGMAAACVSGAMFAVRWAQWRS